MAKHFNRLTLLSCLILEYRNDRCFGLVAERLIDLVTNSKY
jgi:hypothetical protein